MKKVLIAILDAHFLHCIYSSRLIIEKLTQLTGGEFEIHEIERAYYNPDVDMSGKAWLRINKTLELECELNKRGYIIKIDTSEC